MHQAQLHQDNAFITLTWSPEKLITPSLRHRDWQLFMKRLRKYVSQSSKPNAIGLRPGNQVKPDLKISYYMAGEYGSNHRRPHFHACLFGYDFQDKKYWRSTANKSKLYTSATLDQLWGNGFTSTGAVTFESAAYIARYIIAKKTGPGAARYYEHIDEETGEITDLLPEYNRMSLRPAIGKSWYEKYKTDSYPEGQILIRQHKSKTPKYYDKLWKKEEPQKYEEMKIQRELQALEYRNDNTPARLKAKETVTQAKINQLLRKL